MAEEQSKGGNKMFHTIITIVMAAAIIIFFYHYLKHEQEKHNEIMETVEEAYKSITECYPSCKNCESCGFCKYAEEQDQQRKQLVALAQKYIEGTLSKEEEKEFKDLLQDHFLDWC